jgi:thymidine phosphorylase
VLPQEIIRKKREGGALSESEIGVLARGITDGGFSEAQVAAFAMAVFFRGMSPAEAAMLTHAMRDSGAVLEWDLPGPVLDKHSTGGVGDKVSLMLAPMVAACGGYVPMISGRGLGHTGGTLDKLEAIPGYRAQPGIEIFRETVREAGCAIIGQTADLAPADKRFYAVRDVTATVESVPLIAASILSKKLAAGVRGLAMDVKCGSGAFMPDLPAARALAETIIAIARDAALPATALVTGMDEVLGTTAGHALEVSEAVDYLTGRRREPRLHAVTLALVGEMLVLGGLATTSEEGSAKAQAGLESGRAAEAFAKMVAALGGPKDFVENSDAHLRTAPVTRAFHSAGAGYVARMDTRAIGVALIDLGGGRRKTGDGIEAAVGFSGFRAVGSRLAAGEPIALVHAADDTAAGRALAALERAIVIADAPPAARPVIHERIVADASGTIVNVPHAP